MKRKEGEACPGSGEAGKPSRGLVRAEPRGHSGSDASATALCLALCFLANQLKRSL